MTTTADPIDWDDYRRRLRLREERRDVVRRRLGWTDYPGKGAPRRSHRQRHHPEFGGQVAAATAHHGHP